MTYFIDTEFIEDFHKPLFGKRRHFIDMISIALVAEDGREYYAISNEFDLKAVWNKFNLKDNPYDFTNKAVSGTTQYKEYWLRDNVLMPIFYDLALEDFHMTHFKDEWRVNGNGVTLEMFKNDPVWPKDFWWFSKLIQKYGKSNEQIAQEIVRFVMPGRDDFNPPITFDQYKLKFSKPKFYGYYADYDWVLFCSLFGRMIDLPKGFPMYCHDLKQTLEEKNGMLNKMEPLTTLEKCSFHSIAVDEVGYNHHHRYQDHNNFPKQINSHNALDDARWNKRLHHFLSTLA